MFTESEIVEIARICNKPLGVEVLDAMFNQYSQAYYYRFLFHLGRCFRDKEKPIYVELGTHHGYSASHFIAGCDSRVSAYGVDISVQIQEPILSDSQFIIIRGDSRDRRVSDMFKDGSIDVLFIDSHHTYGVVKREIELWLQKMKPTGIMLVDDACGPLYSCSRMWSELCFEKITLPELHAGGWGFGVICHPFATSEPSDTTYLDLFSPSGPTEMTADTPESKEFDVDATLYIDSWGVFYKNILSRGWYRQIENNCGCRFKFRTACINNIDAHCIEECQGFVSDAIKCGDIDACVYTPDEAVESLASFGLTLADFLPLSYQSIADIVAIRQCATKYIVYFSGDSIPWGSSNWVKTGIELLENNPDIMVVNPVWNGHTDHARCWSNPELETREYFLGYGFSDQCYLARTVDFVQNIYHETNSGSDSLYPRAHGNQFEKRVDAWMRNHGKLRATLKNAAYLTRP